MKVGNFDTSEFSSRDGQKSPFPLVVEPALLYLLMCIRDRFGKPIVVNSGYRSPEWNAKVGGAANSFHVKGLAADIRPTNADADKLARLQDICLRTNEIGGVGLYDDFVHVDARGSKARWDFRTKKD
ncbi:MAG: DUF882 domain-containing protein [Exiguobacterium sp.]|nr:DUF882 domain-containing protein [Exiguobacterium sp.]